MSDEECIGMKAHKWKMAIEEGQVSITTERCGDLCQFAYAWSEGGCGLDGDSMEFLEMAEVDVTVRTATDCPAYDTDDDGVPTGPVKPMRGYESGSHYIAHGTRCDCNWWPVVRIEAHP